MCGSYFDSDLQCLKKNNANIRSKLLNKNPEIDTAPTDKKKKKTSYSLQESVSEMEKLFSREA